MIEEGGQKPQHFNSKSLWSSINDVTQFWIPLDPFSLCHAWVVYHRHKIFDPFPLRRDLIYWRSLPETGCCLLRLLRMRRRNTRPRSWKAALQVESLSGRTSFGTLKSNEVLYKKTISFHKWKLFHCIKENKLAFCSPYLEIRVMFPMVDFRYQRGGFSLNIHSAAWTA